MKNLFTQGQESLSVCYWFGFGWNVAVWTCLRMCLFLICSKEDFGLGLDTRENSHIKHTRLSWERDTGGLLSPPVCSSSGDTQWTLCSSLRNLLAFLCLRELLASSPAILFPGSRQPSSSACSTTPYTQPSICINSISPLFGRKKKPWD